MIQTLRLQNFKGIRDIEVGLERLTVLVGPNASGKTSVLQGLEFLVGSKFPIEPARLDGLINEGCYYREGSNQSEMVLSCSTLAGDIKVFLSPPPPFPFGKPWSQEVKAKGTSNQADWVDDEVANVAVSLGRAQLFRFDPARMAEPSSDLGFRLSSDGRGLASTLTLMALNQPDNFLLVQQELKSIIPIVERIRFERNEVLERRGSSSHASHDKLRRKIQEFVIFDLKGGTSISSHSASEGTLLVLGLLTILMSQFRPNLILLDDFDRGLHPLAQREVITLLRKVLDQQPDLQIVATTHSPYLVNSLRPEEVRMTTLRDDGTVACGSLVEHPDFAQWKDEMFPGELWTMFGEKWVADLVHEVVR